MVAASSSSEMHKTPPLKRFLLRYVISTLLLSTLFAFFWYVFILPPSNRGGDHYRNLLDKIRRDEQNDYPVSQYNDDENGGGGGGGSREDIDVKKRQAVPLLNRANDKRDPRRRHDDIGPSRDTEETEHDRGAEERQAANHRNSNDDVADDPDRENVQHRTGGNTVSPADSQEDFNAWVKAVNEDLFDPDKWGKDSAAATTNHKHPTRKPRSQVGSVDKHRHHHRGVGRRSSNHWREPWNKKYVGKYKFSSILSVMDRRFEDIDISNPAKILVVQILKPTLSMLKIFDCIGSRTMDMLKNDIMTNVANIEKVYSKHKSLKTIDQLIDMERKAGTDKDDESATNSLLWLRRSLEFISKLMSNICDEKDTVTAISRAYEDTLKHYHNFFVRQSFKIFVKLMISKRDFLDSLAIDKADSKKQPEYDSDVTAQLRQYATAELAFTDVLKNQYNLV